MPKAKQPPGEASYATLARLLNVLYSLDPPIDNRQVHAWHERQTKNKDGKAFPPPSTVYHDAKRGQPKQLFSVIEVMEWFEAGTPLQHGAGWTEPTPILTAINTVRAAMGKYQDQPGK